MQITDLVFIGTKSKVAALHKGTGQIKWETFLTSGLGTGFVTLLVDGPLLFAHTCGHLFCLNALTGEKLWNNELPGFGYGLASLATATVSASPVPQAYQEQAEQSTAAAAAG